VEGRFRTTCKEAAICSAGHITHGNVLQGRSLCVLCLWPSCSSRALEMLPPTFDAMGSSHCIPVADELTAHRIVVW
jgi:hypothetical protein